MSINKKIGVLGGGQLGMMLYEASDEFPIELYFLDPNSRCSVSHLTDRVSVGSFNDRDAILEFGKDKDIITVEIEHVSVEALKQLEADGKKVFPQSKVLKMVQDKGLQKQFYQDHDIPTSPFEVVESGMAHCFAQPIFPLVLKLRTGGYDGKGVAVVKHAEDIPKAFDAPCVVEELVDFDKEISVIVARNEHGEIKSFPTVEMDFDPQANLVDVLMSPARISVELDLKARNLAEKLISDLEMVGVLAVELFLLSNGDLLVNEVAPRPHNSGHQSIEGNKTSQYAQHLRAICGLSLGETDTLGPSVMLNLLGQSGHVGPALVVGHDFLKTMPEAHLHLYRKSETRPFRKMGHITIVDQDLDSALRKSKLLKQAVKVISKEEVQPS